MFGRLPDSTEIELKPWPNGLASQRKFAKPELAYGLAKCGQTDSQVAKSRKFHAYHWSTCVDLRRLASPFAQGFKDELMAKYGSRMLGDSTREALQEGRAIFPFLVLKLSNDLHLVPQGSKTTNCVQKI